MYKKYIKLFIDIFFSILLILIFSPIMLMVSVLVLIIDGYPVIFKQKRLGLNEKEFTIYKFRSMKNIKVKDGINYPKVTKLGYFLRSTSLDELPQLINILKGDMSFVGPRPLLVHYLPLYNNYQKRRHIVRPGLTGLAQINGRQSATWSDKFHYDINYVENLSFTMDCKIVLSTMKKIITREGNKEIVLEEFQGNADTDE